MQHKEAGRAGRTAGRALAWTAEGRMRELLSLGQVRGWPHALGVAGIGQNLIQGSGAGPGCQSVSLVEAAVQL